MAQVPSTEDLHEGDGTTTVFQFTFPYLKVAEVFVTVDGVNVPFNMLVGSTSQIQTLTPPSAGSVVRIYRNTLAIKPLHLFAQGVPFLPRYVDENNRQLLYATQEAINDTAVTAAEALVVAEEAKDIAQEASDKVDRAVIESAAQLRDDLADGTFSPGWQRHGLGGAIRTVNQLLDTTYVNVWEFEALVIKADPTNHRTWDWTAAVQAAFDMAGPGYVSGPSPHEARFPVLFPTFEYQWSSAQVGYKQDLFFAGSVIRCLDPAATGDLLKFTGYTRVHDATVDMQYSMTYRSAFWCRGRHVHFSHCTVWKARCAWLFGDPSWATDPAMGDQGDSENILGNCETIWCATAFEAYGNNTILHFDDCLMYSYLNTLPDGDPRKAAWEALPANVGRNWGGLVYFNGGALANYTDAHPALVSMVQPVPVGAPLGNTFGKFYLNGTHQECGVLWACGAVDPLYPAQDNKTRVLSLRGVNGWRASNTRHFLDAGGDCLQSIYVAGDCNIYGPTNNAFIYAIAAPVHVDPQAFTGISVDPHQAIHALRLVGYSDLNIVNASGSAQSLTNSPTRLVMPTVGTTDVWADIANVWYDPGTGIATAQVPMRNVRIDVQVLYAAGAATDATTFELYVGGVQVDSCGVVGYSARATLIAHRVAQGQQIEVRAACNVNRTLTGTASNFIKVTGTT